MNAQHSAAGVAQVTTRKPDGDSPRNQVRITDATSAGRI